MRLGADVDELDRLAATLARSSAELGGSHGSIDSSLASTMWMGPDATKFRASWERDRGALRSVSATLEELSGQLRRNANEQRRASASASAGARGGSWFGGEHPFQGFFERVMANPAALARVAAAMGLPPVALAETLLRARMTEAGVGGASGSPYLDFRYGPDGGFSSSFGPNGGQFELWGEVGVGAEFGASTDLGPGQLAGHGEVFAGLEAYAVGEAFWGPDGAGASFDAGAFAGARAGGEASYEIPGLGSAGVNASAAAGLGAWANGDATVSWDEVNLELDLGLVIGIGGEIGFDIEFSPEAIYDDATDFVEGVYDDAVDAAEDLVDDVAEGIDGAVKEVGGFLGF